MKKNFVLVGVPGCGKTTLGKQAANVLGMNFINTDTPTAETLAADDFPLARIFSAAGQRDFLRQQREVIENLRALQTPTIIATGAEAPLSMENLHILREIGWIIHIRRNSDRMLAQLSNMKTGLRLVNMDTGQEINLRESCLKKYLTYIPMYDEMADASITNDGEAAEGLERLLAVIQSRWRKPKG